LQLSLKIMPVRNRFQGVGNPGRLDHLYDESRSGHGWKVTCQVI
jgi:hypothetical protein